MSYPAVLSFRINRKQSSTAAEIAICPDNLSVGLFTSEFLPRKHPIAGLYLLDRNKACFRVD